MKYHFSCYARIKQSSKYVSFIICDANHVYIFFFYIVVQIVQYVIFFHYIIISVSYTHLTLPTSDLV